MRCDTGLCESIVAQFEYDLRNISTRTFFLCPSVESSEESIVKFFTTMTKHPIRKYIVHVHGSKRFAQEFARIVTYRMNQDLPRGAVPFIPDRELQQRIQHHAEMAIDFEQSGEHKPSHRPIFSSAKEESEFDEVYNYLVDVAWDYQEARANHLRAAGRKPDYPRMRPF